MNGNGNTSREREVIVRSIMIEEGRVNTSVHSENPNLGAVFSILMEGVATVIRKNCELTGASPYDMRDFAFEYLDRAIEDFIRGSQEGGGNVPI